ncbi:MAG: hypothetical protein R2810_16745 [Flavobacteriales bacterium]
MDYGTIILIILQLIIGGILWTTIRTQKEILGHYKDIMAVIDVPRIKQLSEWKEEAMTERAISIGQKFVRDEAGTIMKKHPDEYSKGLSEFLEPKFVELEHVAWTTIVSLPPELQEEFIKDFLPHSTEYFLKHLPSVLQQAKERNDTNNDE